MTSTPLAHETVIASPGIESIGRVNLLLFSAWSGLVSGLLEVGTRILRKETYDLNRLYWVSRHFLWMVPAINLVLFLALGLLLSAVVSLSGGRGRWLANRLLLGLVVLPVLWVGLPSIYGPAALLLALGVAARLAPVMERRADGFRRVVLYGLPILVLLVPSTAAARWAIDGLARWKEQRRPLPSPDSPNVLLIVLDTVSADHLSLYGYTRRTCPTLEELAARGIRFDQALATSSWTLPSHATMFTGRPPHELSAGWFTPLDSVHSMIAEFLGHRGYATAGFVANTWYCGTDSGLSRGFTEYRDYAFPRLTAFKTASLVDRTIDGALAFELVLENWLGLELFKPVADALGHAFKMNRKAAEAINQEFLEWLSTRRQPERPFLAFLNYYDAHAPYGASERGVRRFGSKPRNARESAVIRDWLTIIQRGPSPAQLGFAVDCYDDGIADLDEQLGRLVDELDRRAILKKTWIIVAGDHGESFGENPGVYWHGTSLYRPQVHVPLVVIPPPGGPSATIVSEPVSLKDLAATIVEIAGLESDSPFPGHSWSRLWNRSPAPASAPDGTNGPILSEVVPLGSFDPDPAAWLEKPRWPWASLNDGRWKYIRREEDGREELFDARSDLKEQHNLAAEPDSQATLRQMREALDRLTGGPLTPRRFRP